MKSRFTSQQIHDILKQQQTGDSPRKICCQYDISHSTFYVWRRKAKQQQAAKAQEPSMNPLKGPEHPQP